MQGDEFPGDYYDEVLTGSTGKRKHWVDVYFLQPIWEELEARGFLHAKDLKNLDEVEIPEICGDNTQLMLNLWHARGVVPEDPELMSDDEGDPLPYEWDDDLILDYLNRLNKF